MIEVDNMSYSFPRGKDIFQDLSFRVEPGDFTGVLGKNGSGKTTLLDILMGFRKPIAGSIKVLGEDPFNSKREEFSKVAYISQDMSLKEDLLTGQFLEFHSHFYPKYDVKKQNELLELFSISEKVKIGGQSTGQKKRVQIVAALSTCPKLIVIDEITSVLDPEARSVFFDYLCNLNKSDNVTIVLATNIAEDLIGKAKKVLFIDDGRISTCATEDIPGLFSKERSQ